ncbi:MAG: non-canonical purine NTP diphosphatase [Bacteroidia bacterium]
MKLVFATNNKNKLRELQMLLPKVIELVSLADLNCTDEIEETEDTLQGNALLKARYINNKYHLNCFSDDSGLEVEALNGAPGVYSARYAGPEQIADNNIRKILQELGNNPNRNACFKTVIALVLNGKEYLFEGEIKGQITNEKQGDKGFGYDPIFRPEGHTETFAQMKPEEKNKISHRALAVNKLVDFLRQDNR